MLQDNASASSSLGLRWANPTCPTVDPGSGAGMTADTGQGAWRNPGGEAAISRILYIGHLIRPGREIPV